MPNYITQDEAADLLKQVERVLVIGCSGGGKSTLAQRLAGTLNLNYISIDRDIRWLPGWVERKTSERRALYKKMVLGERWIMDGTSPASFDIRLPRTDLVLWVRVPRYLALFSVYQRVLRYYGRTRPDMADGCDESLPDWEFLTYIWNFEKKSVPIVIRNIDAHGLEVPTLQLKSRRAMDFLVSQIES